MLPKYHIILGVIFVILLHFFFPQIPLGGLAIIFLSSFLIDVDHVVYYILKKKDFSLSRAYKWFMDNERYLDTLTIKQRNKIYTGFYFLHGLEILFFLFVLGSLLSIYFMYILLGFLLHLVADLIHDYSYKRSFDKLSLVYSYVLSKNKKHLF